MMAAAKKFQKSPLIRTRIEFLVRQSDQQGLKELIEGMLEQRHSYDTEINVEQVRLLCRILDAIEHPEMPP